MKHIRIFILTICLFVVALATAQTRGVADGAIPGDNKLRYYRLALPVTVSAFEEDLGSDYNNVLRFWQECEDFCNRMFVPLGICFDVVESEALVMTESNLIDENIYNIGFGTELTDAAIGTANYDVGMWVHHRDESAENSGLTQANGVYNPGTKSNGYAKTDKWVVAHELGHIFGAEYHTAQGEGSLMDNEGEFFSFPSIKLIRTASVNNGTGSANSSANVTNSAPAFDTSVMKNSYRIPQGACMAIPVLATDEQTVTYSAIGCRSANVGDVNGEDGDVPHFKSLKPQSTPVIDYSPKYSAGYYEDEFYSVTGTDIPGMSAGTYDIAFLANDMPSTTSYDYLSSNPFYSNYSVWDATVEIVGGTAFNAYISPEKNSYSAGESVTVKWDVNNSYFGTQMLRITMSADYGETFPYVLAESVPATDGSCTVTLPSVNVGNVDVDFVTATRSMRGGIIRVEEIGGIAYTLTTLSPANGGGFTVTGGSDAPDPVLPTTYTINVQANPATSGTATVNGNSTATVDSGSTVTLIATANSGYKFDGWYLNSTLVNTTSPYSLSVTGNATYVAEFSKEATAEPEPGQPAQESGYYYLVNRDTNRREYLYNDALNKDNSLCFTLQSDAAVSTNNGVWYITFNDNNTLGIKNGDGKPVVTGASWAASILGTYTELAVEKTTELNGYTYYSFTNGLNCSDSNQSWFQINGVNFVTTWAGHPDATDCQWRLESVDMKGKSIYDVEINDPNVYVEYTNGTNTEYAYNGGFFITDGAIDDTKLVAKGGNNFGVVVDGYKIRVLPTYTVNVSAENGGTASSSAATVKHGDEVTLTAVAADGYRFDGWYGSDGKLVNNASPYTFEVTGNIDYTAKFVSTSANTYTITVSSNNAGGLAFINTTGITEGVYTENTTVKLTAVEDYENSGFVFIGWYKGETCVSTEKNWELAVTEDATYEARFEKGCVVSVKSDRICYVTIYDENDNPSTGRTVVKSGATVTLSAYIDPYYRGYIFVGWYDAQGNLMSEELNYECTVTGDVSYTAVVELAHYTLTVSTPDKNMGSVQAISGALDWAETVEVGYNTFATISAIPNKGYVFVNWTKGNEVISTEPEYSVPVITDVNALVDVEYVAHFAEESENVYSVSAVVDPFTAGFISFSKKEVEHGGSITLTASVNEGYAFVNWTLDGEVVGSELELTVNNVTKDLRYVANYRVTDPLAGRWFRLKEKSSGKYLDIDHEAAAANAYGQVKISEKDKDSEKQIVLFEKVGDGYKLKSKSGYYVKGGGWNVDAATKADDAAVLMFEETGNVSEYYIKWYNTSNSNNLQYFKVGTANGDDSGTIYVYCDAPQNARATWILEEVADKSDLQALIVETTELFNKVAADKTEINIVGKITSNAAHNTADGNAEGYNDGAGIAGLTDDDPSTYFHSRWNGTSVNEAHYLQINLGEGESLSDFIFEYAVRKAADANNTSPAPTAMEVRVSTDGQNFGDPIAQYAGGTNANSLPAHGDLGETLWNSGVISAGEKIRHIRLTVTGSAGPNANKWNNQYFFAMGTLNLYSPTPSLKDEYKDYPLMTENLLLAVAAALGNANDVNDNDVATTEEVNEALKDLRAQKEALEVVLIPVSFTLSQVTAGNLMERTEPTYIAVKNISGTNNRWFAGTSNVEEFSNSTVLVWEPVVNGQKGSYYIKNTYGKYIQNASTISFGGVEGAAVFTAKNATTKGSGDTKFNGDNGDQSTLANINTADDPNLVRFVTGTQWINVGNVTSNPMIKNGEGGYTVHFVYEATMVSEFAVNVTDAEFATFYAPVNVTLPDNATAYIINSIKEGNWASLAEVEGNVLPKNTAVILYSENPVECRFAVTTEEADAVVAGNKLLGTVNDAYIKKAAEKSYYILSNKNGVVAMYNPVLGSVEDKFMNRANRVYLMLDEADAPLQTAGLRFLFPGTTAVEEVTTEHATVESIYDLQGRKLTEITSPGIYIINGKKVFVK